MLTIVKTTVATIRNTHRFEKRLLKAGIFSSSSLYWIVIQFDIATNSAMYAE
jgi:hypothetical protein